MNPNVKTLWLQALRSGKYQQGQGKLNSNGRYCCLGVLSDIAVENGVVEKDPHGNGVVFYGNELATDDNYPPRAVVDWAGLGANNPTVRYEVGEGGETEKSLADLNDSGHSFAEIAAIIEDQL